MKSLFSGKSILKKAILGGASFCIAILFSSCKDFLNAGQIKGQIEKAIEYANASTYPIYIKYSGSNGIVKSPAGNEIYKKVTDTFTLSFDPIGDYEFAFWKITDDTTKQELPNGEYLSIESVNNSETSCTFVKAPAANMKLCISPILAERPRLLSHAPMLSPELSFKDSAIQAVFDCPMDINSIYYTENELTQIMKELGITDKNDPALLKTTITQNQTEETKYYGYKKEGITYIKNIAISSSETGQSLTGFFKAPHFLTENKLIIPVDDWESLPDYGEIKVELKKDFFYTLNGKPITMSGKEAWTYQINETRDNVGPVINKIEVKCGNKSLVPESALSVASLSRDTVKNLFFSNSKSVAFNFNVRARDTGNGLGPDFYVYYKRVYDSQYKKASGTVKSFSVPFDSMTSYDASLNRDFTQMLNDDGVYELTFCFEDSLGNRTYFPDDKWKAESSIPWTKAYVISVDTTGPDGNAKITYLEDVRIHLILDLDNISADFNQYNLMYKPVNQDDYIKKGPYAARDGEDWWGYNRDNEQDMDLYIQLIDYAGNTTDKKIYKIPSIKKMGNDKFVVYGNIGLIASSYEVTQKEYEQYMTYYGVQHSDTYMAPDIYYGKGDNYPAYCVNWYEAIMYCNLRSMDEGLTPVYYLGNDVTNYVIDSWAENPETKIAKVGEGEDIRYYCNDKYSDSGNHYLSALEKIKVNSAADGYRLPTKDEWQYLARRANLNKNEDGTFMKYAGTDVVTELDTYAWFLDSSGDRHARTVGRKLSNGKFFLYDMSGNVNEWCYTGYNNQTGKKYYMGGSFNSQADDCRIEKENGRYSLSRGTEIGFRVVRTYKPE